MAAEANNKKRFSTSYLLDRFVDFFASAFRSLLLYL